MLATPVDRTRIPHVLDIATYVSMAAMSLLGISGLPTLRLQLLALGLILLFGLLYYFVFQSGRYKQNPHLYFGAQVFLLSLLFLLGSNNSDAFNFLFIILCVHIAIVSEARVAALWIAICFGIESLIILAARGTEGLYAVMFYSIAFVVSGFFGYTIQQVEQARDRNQRLVEELQATQQKLQELAVVEERNRLARDLHDSVKQQVFAISMQLGAARTLLGEDSSAYGPVTEAERLAKQAGAELTTLIRELRPPELERKTLAVALRDYAREWSRQNNIDTELHAEDHLIMSTDLEQTLFRVVQEALANVARHSHATKVALELTEKEGDVLLCIADNGAGFEVEHAQTGVGLHSMQERLTQLGGTLQVTSQKDVGTQIAARLRRA
jgi:signal transduction histidine kinase